MTEINSNLNVQNTNTVQEKSNVDDLKEKLDYVKADTSFIEETSENDLVEFKEEGNSASSSNNEESTAASALLIQQKSLQSQLERLQSRLDSLQKRQKTVQANYDKAVLKGIDTSDAKSKLDEVSGQIDEVNGQIENCISQMGNISNSIVQALTQSMNNEMNNAANSANGVQATGAVTGVNSASGATATGVNTTAVSGEYNAEKGQAIANAANALYGNTSSGGGLCATGVSNAIEQVLGYHIYADGCTYGDALAERSDWYEVTNQYPTAESLYDLPAGAVVSWSPYNTDSAGSIYGHVYIVDGQGYEISDYKTAQSTYFADRGGTYRVFLPK